MQVESQRFRVLAKLAFRFAERDAQRIFALGRSGHQKMQSQNRFPGSGAPTHGVSSPWQQSPGQDFI